MGSFGSVFPPLLPAWPDSPQRLIIAIHELFAEFQLSGSLRNASKVYP